MIAIHQSLLANMEYELNESFKDKASEYESVCKKLEKEDQEVIEKTKYAYLKAILNSGSKTQDISFNKILLDIKNNSKTTKIVKSLRQTPGSPLYQYSETVKKQPLHHLSENTSGSGKPNSPIKDHEITYLTNGESEVNLKYALAQTEDLLQKCRKTLAETRKSLDETRKSIQETDDKYKEAKKKLILALNQKNEALTLDEIAAMIGEHEESLKNKEYQAEQNKTVIQNAVAALKKENHELERCYRYATLANYSIMLSIFSIASAFLYSYIMKFNIINNFKNFSFKNMACRIELGLLIGFLAFTTCFVIFKFKASSSTSYTKAIKSELHKLEKLDPSSSNLNLSTNN